MKTFVAQLTNVACGTARTLDIHWPYTVASIPVRPDVRARSCLWGGLTISSKLLSRSNAAATFFFPLYSRETARPESSFNPDPNRALGALGATMFLTSFFPNLGIVSAPMLPMNTSKNNAFFFFPTGFSLTFERREGASCYLRACQLPMGLPLKGQSQSRSASGFRTCQTTFHCLCPTLQHAREYGGPALSVASSSTGHLW